MIRLSRRYRFAASHRLHSAALTDEENREVFGKCNNPHGHGHNYEVEVTVRGPVDPVTGRVVDLELLDALAEKRVLAPFRYRNLNEEVEVFRNTVPTTENLGIEMDRRLRESWPETFGKNGPCLETIRIWETDRNICEISAKAEGPFCAGEVSAKAEGPFCAGEVSAKEGSLARDDDAGTE